VAAFDLHLPCIVKPSAQDASHGLCEDSVVTNRASLEAQVARVCAAFGGKALVEEFVGGREFNVVVMGTADPFALPIAEIEYSLPAGLPRILTFAAKWEPESVYCRGTTPVCPADIHADLERDLCARAVSAFRLLGCRGYARIDIRLDEEGGPYVLEANPNCDLGPGSGAARQAHAAGMTYREFIERIVSLALDKVAA
jgi:D-alanine-D-alanine ligase